MLIKSALRDWLSVSYVTQYPVPPIFSFPLEGKSREAGKGVRGRVPIGCSIAILTANRRPPERRAIRHRIRVSYSFLPPSTPTSLDGVSLDSRVARLPYESSSLAHPSPLRGPLPLKGTQERYGIYFSVSYDMKTILLTGSLRSPPPIRLRRTSPYAGGRIGFYAFLQRHMAPWLNIHSPTAPRGEGGAVRHQRGRMHFPRPQGGCKGFFIRGRLL